ncbi:MAG: hypothetical protein IJ666_03955 [Ruminococcus sp.]|nr:hypothetical protein [Ruminococcus sp.]
MPESFPKALRNVIAWTEKTEKEFALESEITPKTLSRLLSGETQKPTPQLIMRICMGVKLPFEISMRLMKKSGNELRISKQDLAYTKLLVLSGAYTIEESNVLMRNQGVKELSA